MRRPFFSFSLVMRPKILTGCHRKSCITKYVMKWDSGLVTISMFFFRLPCPAEVSQSIFLNIFNSLYSA